jgi:hypothetical protein
MKAVYAEGLLPKSYWDDEDAKAALCTGVMHGLESEFGGSATEFEASVFDIGPTSVSPGTFKIAATFMSSDDARSLDARLNEFVASGRTEAGDYEVRFDFVEIG